MLNQQTTRVMLFNNVLNSIELEKVPVLIKKKSILKNINNLDDNEITERYKLTNYGQKFIYCDKTELNDRIIIFTAREI
jgi:hypothetical protein